MNRRRVGAIADYKRAARKIRRERVTGYQPRPAPPTGGSNFHPFSDVAQAIRDGAGNYRVHLRGQIIAGPFDTREEAQEWIDDQ